METLKKIFPLSFKKREGVADLIIGILIYLVVGIVASAVIWLSTKITGWVPFVGALIGWALGVVGALVGLYVLAGIVIEILDYCKVFKD